MRDTDCEKQLHERLELADHVEQRAIDPVHTKAAGELQKPAAAKDSGIQALKGNLDAGESADKVAVELAEAMLAAKLADESAKLEAELATKASEIELLKESIQNGEQAKQLAVNEALSEAERARNELKNGLAMALKSPTEPRCARLWRRRPALRPECRRAPRTRACSG